MSKDVMKLALEALENWVECFPQNVDDIDKKAITSLREALNASLAKPDFWEGYVPEPVNPAQQELTNIERHERNVQKFLGEQPAQQEPVAFLVDDDLYYPEEIDWESLKEQGHTVAPLYTKDQL